MSEPMELEEPGTAEGYVEVPVVRDGPLPRHGADAAIPVYLGRDIEIAFLSHTPRIEAQVSFGGSDEAQGQAMRVSAEILETARVRIGVPGAQDLAFGLLRQLIGSGLLAASDAAHEIGAMTSNPDRDERRP